MKQQHGLIKAGTPLSAREREVTAGLLKRICANRSMIVIEHDMAFVEQIASKVMLMHQGKILAEGSMDAVENDPKVIDVPGSLMGILPLKSGTVCVAGADVSGDESYLRVAKGLAYVPRAG